MVISNFKSNYVEYNLISNIPFQLKLLENLKCTFNACPNMPTIYIKILPKMFGHKNFLLISYVCIVHFEEGVKPKTLTQNDRFNKILSKSFPYILVFSYTQVPCKCC